MSRRAAAALAAGTMVAGLVPSPEPAPSPRPRPARPANGAQLAMWRQLDHEAYAARQAVRSDNASRRQATWYKWSLRWAPKRAVSEKLRRPRSSRIQTLKAQGRAVSEKLRRPRSSRIQTLKAQGRPVSGRQWRKLRKLVRAQGRAAA